MSFKQDLHDGKAKEQDFFIRLSQLGFHAEQSVPGLHPSFDVIAWSPNHAESVTTYEVKLDLVASRTNRVALEVFKTIDGVRQPAGLTASRANWYVYSFVGDSNFYLIQPHDLLQMLKDNDYIKLVQGGWKGAYTLALFDKNLFIARCSIL